MKILGETDDGYILQATKDEVARCVGVSSRFAYGAQQLKVGVVIQVNAMYDQISSWRARRTDIEAAQRMLRATADLLGPVVPLVEPEAKGEELS